MIGGKNIPTDEKLYNSIKKKSKSQISKNFTLAFRIWFRIFS